MKHKMKKKVRHYLREISSALPTDYPNKKRILNALKQNIENFLEEHPNAQWKDVIKRFGSATDLANSYIEELSDTDIALSYQIHHRQFLISTAICCMILAFVAFGIYRFYIWWKNDALLITETTTVYDDSLTWEEWMSELNTEIYEVTE